MTYIALARKWRPKSFDEVIGQDLISKALSYSLSENRLHHAYLLTGTRGVGKTTIARILAKCLNCHDGVSDTPCGQCDSCVKIDQGSHIDLIEIDAASKTKVDDIRAILDTVQYKPTQSRFKVIIVDETHMLSGHSFNALLKTLEEPPAHIKFILATTEPKKIPATIQSRCIHFLLKSVSHENLSQHIQTLLDKEQIPYEPGAISHIATAGAGSVRDALTILDQVILTSQGHLSCEAVEKFLGVAQQETIYQLLDHIISSNVGALLDLIGQLSQHDFDFNYILKELLAALHKVSVRQAFSLSEQSQESPFDEKIQAYAQQLSPQDTQLLYQIALMGTEDMKLAPSVQIGFEMIVLRMLHFVPQQANTSLAPQGSVPANTCALQSTSSTAGKAHAPRAAQPPKHTAAPTLQAPIKAAPSPVEKAKHDTKTSTAPFDATPTDSANSAQWASLVKQLKLDGMTRALVENCSLSVMKDTSIHLNLESSHAPLLNDNLCNRLQKILTAHLNKDIKLSITIAQTETDTPTVLKQKAIDAAKQEKLKLYEEDDRLQEIINTFDATVNP